MNNLTKRAITGTVYVLSVIAAIFIHPAITGIYFLIVSIIGLWEFLNVAKLSDSKTSDILPILAGMSVYTLVWFSATGKEDISLSYGIITILSLLTIFIKELYSKRKDPFTYIAYSVLGIIYVVVPLALTNVIINFNGHFSPMVLMSIFIFAWCNDTFAYLTGMKFGKHKLFERISPKKTWEGWIGGFIFTIIAAVVVAYFSNAIPVADFIAIAVITSIIGTFGDLVESMFKRQMNVKDSGNILPGHGGILDRFDILLLVLPAAMCYLMIRF